MKYSMYSKNTENISKKQIQREYPLYRSVRIRESHLDAIKARATRFNQTIDDLIGDMIMKINYYERIGYEMPAENKSW
jgi:hypothetical protein